MQLAAVVESAAQSLRPGTAWTFVEISNPELSIGERLGFGDTGKKSVAEDLQVGTCHGTYAQCPCGLS